MSIEQNINRMADAFERIAGALEKIANGGVAQQVAEQPKAETPKAETPKAAKSETPKAAKSETPKAEAPKAEAAKSEGPKHTKDDLRALGRKLIAGSVPEAEIVATIKAASGVAKVGEIADDKIDATYQALSALLP